MKKTIFMLFTALLFLASACGSDDKDEPTAYDPAAEIAGTYNSETGVTNGKSSYSYKNSKFVIRKETSGGVRYDIIREDGKKLLTNVYTTVGYYDDRSEYVLAAIDEEGTVSQSGRLYYTGKCSVNGVKGYTFTFSGYKEK